MKTTTIGRIGAIVAGAAMLGTAVASALAGAVDVPTNLDKGFFVSNGTPNVQIVVGEKAQASDGAAAGQIAAIIGNMAFTTTTSQQAGGTVEVPGGTTTCAAGSVICDPGAAEGQVKLSWEAVGMIGDMEQKEMDCDVYDGGMTMDGLTEGGDSGDWADENDDPEYTEIYTPESTVGTKLVGACETSPGADVAILKAGEFPNEVCTICYNYCDIALGCEPHVMSEWVEIDGSLIEIEFDCDDEALMVTTTDEGAVEYNVFTDDILTEDILDEDGALVGQSYMGRIILGQNVYYVENIDDDEITIVCGDTGTATTSAAMVYTPPAEGSACDAADSGDTYSIKLVGAQTIEDVGVVDVTLEVTKPDSTTEQVTAGISGTPVVGDIKIKLQRGTAASNVITGEQSFSADLLIWYVPSEKTFEDGETYGPDGVCTSCDNDVDDEDVIGEWTLTFNGNDGTGEDLTVGDVEDLEDDEVLGLADDTDLDDLDITENEHWDDCYEDTEDNETAIIRWLEFQLEELESDEGLPQGMLLQLPFNDGKYLLSDLKFGYMGLLDEDFRGWSMQDTTVISVEVQEVEVYNESEDEMQDFRTAVVLSYVDEEGDNQEVRIDEGPFGEGDVVMLGDDIFKITDMDYDEDVDMWTVIYEVWEDGEWEDNDSDDYSVAFAQVANVTLTIDSQVQDTRIAAGADENATTRLYRKLNYAFPATGSDWYIDNTTDDESDAQLYIDVDSDQIIDLVGDNGPFETDLDGIYIETADTMSSKNDVVRIDGDTNSGAEDAIEIYLDEPSSSDESYVNLSCNEDDCNDIQHGDTDGTLISLSGAMVEVTGDSDVDEPDDDNTNADDVITSVTVTVPENELRPTLFFGTEETQNSTSVTITEAQEGTVVNIGGVDVTVEDFGVSVSGGGTGVGTGGDISVQCPAVSGTCPAVSVETQAPAGIGYNLVVLDNAVDASKNLVLIGGPAVNALTEGLVAASDVCPDSAKIQLVGSKLVVAGCEAKDTMAAAQALITWLKANAA